jgi:rubredoxin
MNRYRCPNCGYVYDEVRGEPAQGFPAQTRWQQIPDDWTCPDCAVRDKVDFVKVD